MAIPDPYNPDPADKELTAKERVFVFNYLQTWDHVAANKEAGFKGGAKKRFDQPHIQKAIAARMSTLSMRADEAIFRLSEQGRARIAMFYRFVDKPLRTDNGKFIVDINGSPIYQVQPEIDWEQVRLHSHLIKAIKQDSKGHVTLELYSAQDALGLVGRHLKLFIDQIDINALTAIKAYVGISPDDWDEMDETGDNGSSDNGATDDINNDPDS